MNQKIKNILRRLTKHDYIEITTRGNAAIKAALSILPKHKKVLIPEEGGWLTYKTIPKRLGLETTEVHCHAARINLNDLKNKLQIKQCGAFLYQNPGGYFAEQPIQKIYDYCQKNNCLVFMDVSGSIGTELCNGAYADVLVGSFGKWKLVSAGEGGFISSKNKKVWDLINENLVDEKEIKIFDYESALLKILPKLQELPERIGKLALARDAIVKDLQEFSVVHSEDRGIVVVVRFSTMKENEKIVDYCQKNRLEWTECPRYIRLNERAISIEVKRL